MEPFFIRDPAHDYVTVDRPLIRDLLACPEVQRLRRIRQLGFSFVTYPGAEHNRFSHSVGTADLMRQALLHLRAQRVRLSRLEQDGALAAALVHDVGHGPFSHCLERAMDVPGWPKHEEVGRRILTEKTQVRTALRRRAKELPQLVWRLLKGEPDPTAARRAIHGLLAGNFDLDRLDFLVRDSVFTGLRTGFVDVRRLINTLQLHDGKILAVEAKGQTAVEEFLVARHFMYCSVYFHKTTRGMEAVFLAWVRRIKDERESLPSAFVDSALGQLLLEPFSLSSFLRTDDTDVFVSAKALEKARDPVLRDLSRRLLRRQPFRVVMEGMPDAHRMRDAMDFLDAHGVYPSRYYFHQDAPSDVPYNLMPYWSDPEKRETDPIYILVDGEPREITSISLLVRSLASQETTYRVYVPEQCRNRIAGMLA